MLFSTVVDEQGRAYQVRRHVVGNSEASDAVVYEEKDTRFFVGVSLTSSKDYVVIHTADHVTSEAYLIPAADPSGEPRVVSTRRTGHKYHLDHQGDRFVIKTNDTHKNARLVTAPNDDPSESAWQTLVAGSDEHYIRDFAAFADFIVVQERLDGLDQIRLIDRAGESSYVRFPESSYGVGIGANKEFEARTVRLNYTSLVTPDTVFDCDLQTGALRERKVQRIPSGYDPSSYVTERALAPARDGVRRHVGTVRLAVRGCRGVCVRVVGAGPGRENEEIGVTSAPSPGHQLHRRSFERSRSHSGVGSKMPGSSGSTHSRSTSWFRPVKPSPGPSGTVMCPS